MAVNQNKFAPPAPMQLSDRVFAVFAGVFLFVAILKFGTPIILDDKIQPPENALAAVYESWQVKWGYWLMVPLVAAGLAAIRWKALNFRWPMILPLVWLGWQYISATQTVSPHLTAMTLGHFTACCVLFYLGCFGLKGETWPVWTGLALALCWLIHAGFEQHFGGLEATRRFMYSMTPNPDLPTTDPAYLKRIASPRIYATFSSADAFAGAIELLLPVTLVFLWQITPKVRKPIRCLFVLILAGCALACLYWSGSKAGWLVGLLMAAIAVGRWPIAVKWKAFLACAAVALVAASAALRLSHSSNTDKDKQKVSIVSRYAYWRGAIKITESRPLFGGGPGTFSLLYPRFQRPEDDFSKLCHNDYLEQASDSGVPGSIAYLFLIIAPIIGLYRYCIGGSHEFSTLFAIWLGVFGLCVHSFVDYHLYVPSLAWPLFFFLGYSAQWRR